MFARFDFQLAFRLLTLAQALAIFAAGVTFAAENDVKPTQPVTELAKLPEAISSFGAAIDGGYLYVYSGHIGTAHEHSKKNLSQKFSRLKLDGSGNWESLPVGPGLQSVALVAHKGMIYRVGGLSALNEPGADEDLVSTTDFARFDPGTKKWQMLAPLPVGRSSHDAVVVGDKLYVIGGWNLGKEKQWHRTALSIDLGRDDASWTTLPEQPFQRRALAVAELNGRVYALGGMSDKGPSSDVHYFDPQSQAWQAGTPLPGKPFNGFGCAACAVGGKLYATTMDGEYYVLGADGRNWEPVGKLQEPRFLHRLLPQDGKQLLAIAGASHTVGHLDSIERLALPQSR